MVQRKEACRRTVSTVSSEQGLALKAISSSGGGLRVDGEVRGNISCESGQEGTLVISEKASVEGAISVGHVVINGAVIGPIFAAESLELLPLARVTGDVEYHQIEMQQGAVIQGRLVHQVSASTGVELKLAASN